MGDALKTDMTRTGRLALKQVAAAVAVTAAICAAPSAWALSLGRLTVQSALGEGLRAEIDVTSLTPDEASNLRVRVAPPDSYRIAGVDYNPVLPATSVTLQRRADGTPFLRISSDQSVQEPFVDVILEISWSSGRLLREYTLLFDPPATARAPSAPAPAIAAAPAPAPTRVEPPVQVPAPVAAAPTPAPTAPAPALSPAPVAPARGELALRKPAAEPDASASSPPTEYRVKRGDTLTSISSKLQSGGASLDQALVGLFRGNPQAFTGDNMNRLKAGVVLNVPSSEQMTAIDAQEARQIIQAQSADFNAYRQRLASSVPEPKDDTAPARQATGTVRAEVQDNKQSQSQTQDRLRLDKGKPATGAVVASAEDAIAKERAAKEAAARATEIQRNVEELKKLQAASEAQMARKPAAAVAASSPLPALSVGAAPEPAPVAASAASAPPAVVVAAAEPAASQASAPEAAAAASDAASPAAMAVAPAASVMPSAPAPEQAADDQPSLIDSLSENPWVLPGAGLVLALLAGLGYYRLRGKGKEDAGVTSFLESRLQPDSFFGASGGQRIDTRDASGAPSSMSYSLSQIDAIGDVDPVAEADVYLAYGRDLQAEEILKEAMRANPERLAIRTKLLEVYAKRRDTKGYELLAGELYGLTGGQGEDWVRAQELGRSIDPENPLYEPGGQPGSGSSADVGSEMLGASTMPQSIVPSPSRFEHSVPDLDLTGDIPSGSSADVDLDISMPARMDEAAPSVPSAFSSAPAGFDAAPSVPGSNLDSGTHSLDFDLHDLPQFDAPAAAPSSRPSSIDLADISLDLDAAPSVPANLASTDTMSAFDVGEDDGSDPLARKLELAEEFNQIGDYEGARDLLQEVIENADGALKAKAQAMLDGLA
ncbi:putative transmembrane protein [Leptothrix cholodnii SP-6]|uniref:Putative transmembrane protein n=1 Tax=Leptothrix cholodnii (strain ATCC 51168 / LMG 8142 / SP-6) TaxID=395495 RepID=B1XY45_LEPCP|nr:putative transmembrane protein [Leptothrix cholodnii SP-6]